MTKPERVFRVDRLKILQGLQTQQEFADRIGINQSQLQKYIHGRVEPTAAVIARMSKRLNVSADYLLGLVDRPYEIVSALSGQERALLDAVERGLDINALQALVAYLSGKGSDK